MPRSLLLSLAALSLASTGCAHNQQLQYDLGRATTTAFQAQADLSRASAADATYSLTGVEALEMRARVTEMTTDEESGEAETVDTVRVR